MKKLAATIVLLAVLAPATADSLYPTEANTGFVPAISLFADNRAHKVGDPLTVVITETASGTSSATTTTTNSDSGQVNAGFGPIFQLIKAFGISNSGAAKGTGLTTRSDTLNARVAVIIKEVYPNNTFKIEGTRRVGNNAETQIMTFTGIVRQQDIAVDNTVQSPLVADAQIQYTGKGPVSDKQKPGLITRIFKIFF
ncbi:MAG TPA: flagellar basal body L-ring protein FlgH [Capsulimonadaceae bacterium]|jgi:flagellar L-ring protein precursor FlgH